MGMWIKVTQNMGLAPVTKRESVGLQWNQRHTQREDVCLVGRGE
jgi:hypothetical protein